MSPDLNSTIGRELRDNYALQLMTELQFVKVLTEDQPFIPKYFGFDVDLNKQGALPFEDSVARVPHLDKNTPLQKGVLVVDSRPQAQFKAGHVRGAINIQNGDKFETWLGSIVNPDEPFYLIGEDADTMDTLIRKAAKIGYEQHIKGVLPAPDSDDNTLTMADTADVVSHPDQYTIVDVRNTYEAEGINHFANAINIPLPELRDRIGEIPTGKPIVVHCAAGYRSAAGSSIVAAAIPGAQVYDFGEAITTMSS
jgi:hydroxyacylglutathione hydrolase